MQPSRCAIGEDIDVMAIVVYRFDVADFATDGFIAYLTLGTEINRRRKD